MRGFRLKKRKEKRHTKNGETRSAREQLGTPKTRVQALQRFFTQKNVRPSENLVEQRRLRINNLHMPLLTEGDYQRRSSQEKRKTALFEKYLPLCETRWNVMIFA